MYTKQGSNLADTVESFIAVAVCEDKNLIAVADEKNMVLTINL